MLPPTPAIDQHFLSRFPESARAPSASCSPDSRPPAWRAESRFRVRISLDIELSRMYCIHVTSGIEGGSRGKGRCGPEPDVRNEANWRRERNRVAKAQRHKADAKPVYRTKPISERQAAGWRPQAARDYRRHPPCKTKRAPRKAGAIQQD